MINRSSGVLLHVSSLPGAHGIGCFGKAAKQFIDFLADVGCKCWQVLPFNPTDQYNSPYASISAFAGNINFIDLEQLHQKGLLTKDELQSQEYENPYVAAYDFLETGRKKILYQAFLRVDAELRAAVKEYAEKNADWLPDYALYCIIKEAQGGKPWNEWEYAYKFRSPAALEKIMHNNRAAIEFLEFCQYLFDTQWREIRQYATKRNVSIIGDMPIYISIDSADVWSNSRLFDLDSNGIAKHVAGVPPDYFSKDGQKWGQALYRWDRMAAEKYTWWMNRLRKTFELFDMVRIDHFRAFAAYWAVPEESPTAREGQWLEGPGYEFFANVFEEFSSDRIIAEDLGEIDDKVRELMEETGLPGMRVMQFGFLDFSNNLHLPHNYPMNSFAYTGTHDNNTLLGWLWEATPEQRQWALAYCSFQGNDWAEGGSKSHSIHALINALWQSSANTVIVPLQDLLGYGNDTRMNIPGVPEDNWKFRFTWNQLEQVDRHWLRHLNEIYKRL